MEKRHLISILLTVLVMAVVSALLLVLLSVLTSRMELGQMMIRMAVRGIYLISCLVGGFFIGKRIGSKKFLWGLLAGILYFVILFAFSRVTDDGGTVDVVGLLTALMLTAPAGMIGGMIS